MKCKNLNIVQGGLEDINYYDGKLLSLTNIIKLIQIAVLTTAEISAEIPLVSQTIETTEDETLKRYLEKRQSKLLYAQEKIFPTNEDGNPSLKFLGTFSYDIRVKHIHYLNPANIYIFFSAQSNLQRPVRLEC